MKTKLLLSLALLVAACASAAEGYLTKSASGTTSASVTFPAADQPMRLVSFDVTTDDTTNTLSFATAALTATNLVAAYSTNTTLTLGKSTVASNDLLVLQNSSDAALTIYAKTNAHTTNAVLELRMPLRAALGNGEDVYRKLTTGYTVLWPAAADATLLYLSQVNGLESAEKILLDTTLTAGTNGVGTVDSVATNAYKAITLDRNCLAAVPGGSTVYQRTTTYKTGTALRPAETNTFIVASTAGIAPNDVMAVVTPGGMVTNLTVNATNATTITWTDYGAAWALPIGTRAYVLSATSYTTAAGAPTTVNDRVIITTGSTGINVNSNLVVAPTGTMPFEAMVKSIASTNIYAATLSASCGAYAAPGHTVYELTNATTTAVAAAAGSSSIRVASSAGYASGQSVVLGGSYLDAIVNATPTSFAYTLWSFTNTLGQSMSAGDKVYVVGTPVATTIGIGTVRQSGLSLYTVPPGKPLVLTLIGTNACSINAATVLYGN